MDQNMMIAFFVVAVIAVLYWLYNKKPAAKLQEVVITVSPTPVVSPSAVALAAQPSGSFVANATNPDILDVTHDTDMDSVKASYGF